MLETFLATYTQTLAQSDDAAPTLTEAPAAGQQAGETAPADGGQGTNNPNDTGGGSIFGSPLMIMALFLVVVWIFMLRSTGKDKKKKAELLSSMKKGSKVQTIGGILGTIVDIRDDVVVVKIDENNNTRMRFNRSAIQTVIEDKKD
ncbi:preprotein translocase subunit YajC [Planctomycetota bacterium]|nr:preprotein translocase subunit YajC [Planctomycetota bacterium]